MCSKSLAAVVRLRGSLAFGLLWYWLWDYDAREQEPFSKDGSLMRNRSPVVSSSRPPPFSLSTHRALPSRFQLGYIGAMNIALLS